MSRLILWHLFFLVGLACYWEKSYSDQEAIVVSPSAQVAISPDVQQLSFSKLFFKHATYSNLSIIKNKIIFFNDGMNNDTRCK